MNNNSKIKVAVAMSGGVDSSVAAALIKNKGYKTIGIFIHFWSENSQLEKQYHKLDNKCCSIEAQEKARKVAKIIDIPFYVMHFEKEFKKYVVDYFINEYRIGNTPNPCVMCNKNIKFDFLLNRIISLNIDFLATGHYAKKEESKENNGKYKIFRAKDKEKDQTYFLYNLTQEQIKYLLFPIGKYKKSKVRELAASLDLPTAERRESQGICFVLEKEHNEFLKRYIDNIKPGKVEDTEGKIIGKHQGLPFYTLGQRKGIGIAGKYPYYVVELDYHNNILVVSDDKNDKRLYSKYLVFGDSNWISGKEPSLPIKVKASIRHRHKPANAKIYNKKVKKYYLEFTIPQRAVMPGQSVVFYKGDELIGGGIIKNKNFTK